LEDQSWRKFLYSRKIDSGEFTDELDVKANASFFIDSWFLQIEFPASC